MLQLLFEQYPGFKEIRMIEAKPGIAFVEYQDDVQSSIAMEALQSFKITPQNPMVVSFAKKWKAEVCLSSGNNAMLMVTNFIAV